eukprot:3253952-Pleurochrysis_carterae.AAC.1
MMGGVGRRLAALRGAGARRRLATSSTVSTVIVGSSPCCVKSGSVIVSSSRGRRLAEKVGEGRDLSEVPCDSYDVVILLGAPDSPSVEDII